MDTVSSFSSGIDVAYHFTATGRVLKKHGYSKRMIFVDFVYSHVDFHLNRDMINYDGPFCGGKGVKRECQYEFASIVIKRHCDEDNEMEQAAWANDDDNSEEGCIEGSDGEREEKGNVREGKEVDTEDIDVDVGVPTSGSNTGPVVPSLISGDIIRIRGMIQNLDNFTKNHTARPSFYVLPQDIEVLHRWPIDTCGFFAFHATHLEKGGSPFATCGALSYPLPSLVIQCKQQLIQRVHPVLQDLLSSSEDSAVRESSTSFIKSSDRLLLVHLNGRNSTSNEEGESERKEQSLRAFLHRLTTHPVLSSAVMRVYSGYHDSHTVISAACHAHLDDAMTSLVTDLLQKKKENDPNIEGVRLQVFPKSYGGYVTQKDFHPDQDTVIQWNPKTFSHVLSLYFTDGLWVASLVHTSDTFIGDLREKPLSASLSAGSSSSSGATVEAAVCRAQAKLEEVMVRRKWVQDTEGQKYHYRFGIDVGASPGGWTAFLAHGCAVDRILSVDRGELALPEPWPSHVTHWKVLGDDAITTLQSERDSANSSGTMWQGIDLYCCDANITPITSINMLLRCKELDLLSKEENVVIRIVITLKNVYRKKLDWDTAVNHCLQTMRDNGFEEVDLVHLLANTQKETTMTAIYRRCKE